MKKRYVPDRGDLVWLTFNPPAGHEQAGRRPALVVSPALYNKKVGLALFCPITSKIKGYPFEARIPEGFKARGVVLADQVKSLDWRARKVTFSGKLPDDVLSEVIGKINTLIYL
ncbi:MAG: endoribonuclease MazF [Candidatus Auribacterota bacterium]|nr:endoribonuclease MazF [Candidatus Auribacterota bacterium]